MQKIGEKQQEIDRMMKKNASEAMEMKYRLRALDQLNKYLAVNVEPSPDWTSVKWKAIVDKYRKRRMQHFDKERALLGLIPHIDSNGHKIHLLPKTRLNDRSLSLSSAVKNHFNTTTRAMKKVTIHGEMSERILIELTSEGCDSGHSINLQKALEDHLCKDIPMEDVHRWLIPWDIVAPKSSKLPRLSHC